MARPIKYDPREQLAGFGAAQAQAMTKQLQFGRSEARSVAGPLFEDQLQLQPEEAE